MTRLAVLLLAVCACAHPLGAAAQGPPPQSLDDLAFMAGCWRGDFEGGAALEEYYTIPSTNLMLGASRFLRGDRVVQFEFSRITADSSGVMLLPYPGGSPSEHGFRLTELTPASALFEAPQHDFPKRIRYILQGDSLTARIDGGAGDSRVQEWTMRPTPCRP